MGWKMVKSLEEGGRGQERVTASVGEMCGNECTGDSVDFGSEDIHDVAGVLKMFLRELPTPILTYNIYERVIASGMFRS